MNYQQTAMKNSGLAIAAGVLLLIAGGRLSAQPAFEPYILKYEDFKETPDTKWSVDINGKHGALKYIGAEHSDDPDNVQFEVIRKQFYTFKPTIVFYEGPDRGIAPADTTTIRLYGESGYVRFLASQRQLKTISLEPQFSDTYKYLADKFGQADVDVYMLCKEAMRLRTRKKLDSVQLTDQVGKMITVAQQLVGKPLSIGSINELAIAFSKKFGDTIKWWQAPQNWFDPLGDQSLLTNRINQASSGYRNVYMVGVLSEQVRKGERVFAVVGKNHVPLQEKALSFAIGQ